jgi:hypothetical protein
MNAVTNVDFNKIRAFLEQLSNCHLLRKILYRGI